MKQGQGETQDVECAAPQAVPPLVDAMALNVSDDVTAIVSRKPRREIARQIWRSGKKRFATALQIEEAHGLFFLLTPVLLGLGAVIWFLLPGDPSSLALFALLGVAVVLTILTFGRDRRIAGAGAAVALVAAGMLLAAHETQSRATIVLDTQVTVQLTGRVVSREAVAGGGWRYTLDVVSTQDPALKRPPQRVALLVRARHEPVAPGEGIGGRARLSPPSGPALPGLSDFAFSSYFAGIGAIGYFYGAPQKVSLDAALPTGLVAEAQLLISHLRSEIGTRIRAVIPGDAGAFATAMVTDERRAMSRETTEALRLSGLAHIIAISGLNMALSAGIFFVGLRMLFSLHQGLAQAFPVKKLAAFGALIGVTAYYLLSGNAVSAERAWLMMSIMLIAVLIDRPSISMRNVALSALVILVLSPSEVMGAGFQMSFAATAALVAGYALYTDRSGEGETARLPAGLNALGKVWHFFAGIAITSIIGGLSTAIFSIAHFQQLAVWGLPANLAAMPIVSFIVMPFGLVAMLLMPFGLEAWPLKVMGFGLDMVIGVAREVSSWGGEGSFGLMPAFVFPMTVIGFLLLIILRTRLRLIGAAIMAVTFCIGLVLSDSSQPNLIISGDGTLVGLTRLDGIATNRRTPPEFIFGQWRRALKETDHIPPEMLAALGSAARPEPRKDISDDESREAVLRMKQALTDTEPDLFACEAKAWCAAQSSDGPRIITLENPAYLKAACAVSDIIILQARWRKAACEEGALVMTGVTLARSGAVAMRFTDGDGNAIWTAKAALGGSNRAWNRHRFYDWRDDRFVFPDEGNDTNDPNESGEGVSGNGDAAGDETDLNGNGG
ncbi:MAG: ComEC family competence protein [Proteobacteria bacterium]|nr:ComEC family competence protein [Pseudomonadota bacterium]